MLAAGAAERVVAFNPNRIFLCSFSMIMICGGCNGDAADECGGSLGSVH
jgi:hypothetical protein